MKKLIWKLRYAARIRRYSMAPWLFCWECAGIAIAEYPDEWREWHPADAADEEMSYWGD